MLNYGLSSSDFQNVKRKLEKQKNYLESQTFLNSQGEVKSLLDVSYSANLSARYYPRILNKVNTFVSFNLMRDYKPIFLTVTLDGFFRDFLKGDYKRFDLEKRQKYLKHIPNNDRNGYIMRAIDHKEKLIPKDLYKILSHQMFNFLRSSTLQRIRKDGFDYSYIRVTEPHKDGVPHFHMLFYVPEQYLSKVYFEFKKFFPAPQNHKKINFKENKRSAVVLFDDVCETQGFQIAIKSVAGYILKYILKSFRNLIEDKDLDYLQAWYIHNKIPRLISSHTLLTQDHYHKLAILDDDWYYLTHIKQSKNYTVDRSKNYFCYDDGQGRHLIGDNGLYLVMNCGRIVRQYGEKKEYIPVPHKINQKYQYVRDIIYSDGTSFFSDGFAPKYTNYAFFSFLDFTYDDLRFDRIIPVSRLSNFALFNEYENFDFDLQNPKRFALVHNELVERGLINDFFVSLNDYNEDFNYD
ncbi:MAG: replication endonuclease [Arcobacteraceae bacterium]|nr:replication endonuclease [Arcobacteraceae bacterium]MDD3602338.1 replication endonuclease [Sulfurovum sp.]